MKIFPVMILTGARQTGKSTLARIVGGNVPYLSLGSFQTLDQARTDPASLVTTGEAVILDEVQRAPDLLLAIKQQVDRERRPGQFLLTGSANLLMMKEVADSLAGRAGYLTLWPLVRREKLGLGTCGNWSLFFERPVTEWPRMLPPDPCSGSDWRGMVREGGFPDPGYRFRDDPATRERWFEEYARTYLERDLRDLSAVHDLAVFRRLMRLAALRIGGVLNRSDLARDAGIPGTTAMRYLDLLVTTYQMVLLPAYSVTRTKRVVKSPKLYWNDPALAMHLAGETEPRGEHFENLILQDLLTWRELQTGLPQLLYWRTHTHDEVDFVIEWRGRLLPVEVKAARTLGYGDTKSLRAFLAEYPDLAAGGIILYDGAESYWATKQVLAVPWGRVV